MLMSVAIEGISHTLLTLHDASSILSFCLNIETKDESSLSLSYMPIPPTVLPDDKRRELVPTLPEDSLLPAEDLLRPMEEEEEEEEEEEPLEEVPEKVLLPLTRAMPS